MGLFINDLTLTPFISTNLVSGAWMSNCIPKKTLDAIPYPHINLMHILYLKKIAMVFVLLLRCIACVTSKLNDYVRIPLGYPSRHSPLGCCVPIIISSRFRIFICKRNYDVSMFLFSWHWQRPFPIKIRFQGPKQKQCIYSDNGFVPNRQLSLMMPLIHTEIISSRRHRYLPCLTIPVIITAGPDLISVTLKLDGNTVSDWCCRFCRIGSNKYRLALSYRYVALHYGLTWPMTIFRMPLTVSPLSYLMWQPIICRQGCIRRLWKWSHAHVFKPHCMTVRYEQ